MENSTLDSTAPSRTVSILGGLFFLTLAAFFIGIGVWATSSNHSNYIHWLADHTSVIILDTGSNIFYGMPIFTLAILTFGLYGLYMGIAGRRNVWFDRNCVKPTGYMVVIGLVVMFVGQAAGTSYWEQRFQSEGYVRCNGSFILTSRWSIDVWALSPSICMDPKLKDALRHSEGSVYEINDYYSPPEDRPGAS